MKKILEEIMELDGVIGCLFLSREGQVAHVLFPATPTLSTESHNWPAFIKALGNIAEADMLFEDKRVFLRRTTNGYLLVVAEPYAILSLIKLNCDILVQKLNMYKPKGFSRFFNK